MKFICVATEQEVRGPCKVSSCMWWSTNAQGCIAHAGVPEQEEVTDEFIAKHKGITVKEAGILRKRGCRTIERLLILHKFLEWVGDTLVSYQYPHVQGYHDPELQQTVQRWCANRWPYTVRELAWNIGKVYCTLSPELWAQYSKAVKSDIDGLRTVGVTPEDAKMLRAKFRAAARKHKGE